MFEKGEYLNDGSRHADLVISTVLGMLNSEIADTATTLDYYACLKVRVDCVINVLLEGQPPKVQRAFMELVQQRQRDLLAFANRKENKAS